MNLFIINLFFVILNGVLAYSAFKDGEKKWAWFNLFASALNLGSALAKVL